MSFSEKTVNEFMSQNIYANMDNRITFICLVSAGQTINTIKAAGMEAFDSANLSWITIWWTSGLRNLQKDFYI